MRHKGEPLSVEEQMWWDAFLASLTTTEPTNSGASNASLAAKTADASVREFDKRFISTE